jgi:hypothetical protein
VADYPDALAESISELSRLLVNEEALEDTLHRVAELACGNISGCDLAGVTLVRDGKAETAVFTDLTSPEVDAAQYETGSGPCLDAYRQQQVFRIESTTEDEPWRAFSHACVERGIHSTISFPLAARDHATGALNLYSKSRDAFNDNHVEIGTLFSEQGVGRAGQRPALRQRLRALPAAQRGARVEGDHRPGQAQNSWPGRASAPTRRSSSSSEPLRTRTGRYGRSPRSSSTGRGHRSQSPPPVPQGRQLPSGAPGESGRSGWGSVGVASASARAPGRSESGAHPKAASGSASACPAV